MLKNTAEFSARTESRELSPHQAVVVMDYTLGGLPKAGRVLLVSPDITRCYSCGGVITSCLYHRLSREAKVRIMPATRTHRTISREEQIRFFGKDVPGEVFLYHDWRKDTVPIGTVSGVYCGQMSGGKYTLDIGAEVNRCVVDGGFDLILSAGQTVPYEVIDISNYTKNILVGLGGRPITNGTHMLGALCSLETIMGNTDMPVRAVFDYGEEYFLWDVPLAYILVVASGQEGRTALHGILTGASRRVYEHAVALAKRHCITQAERWAEKMAAYLKPEEFSTTWVGNETIYRIRMMTEDGGELLVVTPGIKGSGENPEVDGLICRYDYRGTPCTMELMEDGAFPGSAMVPVHMIYSSSEGRFTVIYAVDLEYVSQDEISRIGHEFMGVKDVLVRYLILEMEDGWQEMEDGEEICAVKVPALGSWKVTGAQGTSAKRGRAGSHGIGCPPCPVLRAVSSGHEGGGDVFLYDEHSVPAHENVLCHVDFFIILLFPVPFPP